MDLLRTRLWITLSAFCVHIMKPISSADVPVLLPAPSVVLFPGGEVIFNCNTTAVTVQWKINGTLYAGAALPCGNNLFNLTTLVVNVSINASTYACVIPLGISAVVSNITTLFLAAAPDQVPDIMVITDSIAIDGDNVTLTLSWGEPFNNFDPIVKYTVSCSGDATCPPNFTTTDNTIRSYTITNLTPMTDYTISVVATNSIGSGEAGEINFTTPSLPDGITEVMLICEVMNQINQCTVQWDPIRSSNPLEQPLVYEVNYNGAMQRVTSPNTILTFTAPSLPDGVFNGSIAVTVTAINRFGRGMPVDPEYAVIMSTSINDAQVIIIPEDATNSSYSITVNCIINPASTADICEVMVTANGQAARIETAPVTNGMATVTIGGLACGITYAIITGGTLDGDLVGPRSSHGTTIGPCPPLILRTTAAITSDSMIDTIKLSEIPPTTPPSQSPTGTLTDNDDNTGAIVGGVIGGICGVVLLMLIIILLWWFCIRNREKNSRPRNAPLAMAMNDIPVYDAVQDHEISDTVKMEPNPAYQGLPSDQVKMETNPAYQVLASDHTIKEPDPAYEVLASDIANKGSDPAYQDLSSYSGRASVGKQKPAGDVNYYEDIINEQNITMTKNPSYAVP